MMENTTLAYEMFNKIIYNLKCNSFLIRMCSTEMPQNQAIQMMHFPVNLSDQFWGSGKQYYT